LVSLTLGLALPATSLAAPGQGPTAEGPAAESKPAPPAEAEVRSALEAGDLTSARELAVARRKAEPSVDNLTLEAEVWVALGDYERAKAALDQAIAAGPEPDAALVQLRDDLDLRSRGALADEPASTHRARLDRERADRLAALEPVPPPSEAIDGPPPKVPIVKKWYFWVTLGAIVATAGAIVGVAVASGLEERRDRQAVGRQPAPAGGMTIRF